MAQRSWLYSLLFLFTFRRYDEWGKKIQSARMWHTHIYEITYESAPEKTEWIKNEKRIKNCVYIRFGLWCRVCGCLSLFSCTAVGRSMRFEAHVCVCQCMCVCVFTHFYNVLYFFHSVSFVSIIHCDSVHSSFLSFLLCLLTFYFHPCVCLGLIKILHYLRFNRVRIRCPNSVA